MKIEYQAVRSQTEAPKRYRYTGKERDEETGFNYHGARYYAQWLGRWNSPDPEHLLGRNQHKIHSGDKSPPALREPEIPWISSFVYVRNNPIVFSDIRGRSVELGHSYKGEYSPMDDKEPTRTEKTAKQQLNSIRKFLQIVGVAQAKKLGLSGQEFEQFVSAESDAVSISEKNNRFLSSINIHLARQGRGGRSESWVMSRLHHLTKARSLVKVATASRVFEPHGEDPWGRTFPIIKKGLESFIPVGVRTDPIEGYSGRPLSAIGRTIVHELVTHAWRDVFWPNETNVVSFRYSGHILSKDRKHFNWTDIESELLDHYEALYAPFPSVEKYFRKPETKTPVRSELLKSYRLQLKSEREMIMHAGGIMGRELFWRRHPE